MKFIVDSLPYYGDNCPFYAKCGQIDCPKRWDNKYIYSDLNPHKCEHLIEYKQFIKEQRE